MTALLEEKDRPYEIAEETDVTDGKESYTPDLKEMDTMETKETLTRDVKEMDATDTTETHALTVALLTSNDLRGLPRSAQW